MGLNAHKRATPTYAECTLDRSVITWAVSAGDVSPHPRAEVQCRECAGVDARVDPVDAGEKRGLPMPAPGGER